MTKNKTSDSLNGQEERVARLLLNFSSPTANEILNRFEKPLRDNIRDHMHRLSSEGCLRDDESLGDFADFLYFKPHEARERDAILKPTVHRLDPGGRDTSGQGRLSYRDILGFNDESLDALLRAAPPELTVSVLCCSPESFIHRVLARLSPEESSQVRSQINQSPSVDLKQMQSVHQTWCDFANSLVNNGMILQ